MPWRDKLSNRLVQGDTFRTNSYLYSHLFLSGLAAANYQAPCWWKPVSVAVPRNGLSH